jgi:hypothetical protein
MAAPVTVRYAESYVPDGMTENGRMHHSQIDPNARTRYSDHRNRPGKDTLKQSGHTEPGQRRRLVLEPDVDPLLAVVVIEEHYPVGLERSSHNALVV